MITRAQGTLEEFFSKKFSKKSSAQGTLEYLVIIAVVVVLVLVVVGLLVNQTSSAGNVSSSISKIGSSSGVISISEAVVDVNGNGLLSLVNNSGSTLVLTKVVVGSNNTDFSNVSLVQENKKTFSLRGISSGCSCVGYEGKARTCSVIIYATSEYGLAKQFMTSISVDCVSRATAKDSNSVVQPIPELPYIYLSGSKLYIHPTDNNTGIVWGCQGTSIPAAQSDTDGSGNTIAIVGGCLSPNLSSARICSDLSFGGYDDWYLPAINQLTTIYTEITAGRLYKGDYNAQWANFLSTYYWSSSEHTVNPTQNAEIMWGTSGNTFSTGKNTSSFPIRCVRLS